MKLVPNFQPHQVQKCLTAQKYACVASNGDVCKVLLQHAAELAEVAAMHTAMPHARKGQQEILQTSLCSPHVDVWLAEVRAW